MTIRSDLVTLILKPNHLIFELYFFQQQRYLCHNLIQEIQLQMISLKFANYNFQLNLLIIFYTLDQSFFSSVLIFFINLDFKVFSVLFLLDCLILNLLKCFVLPYLVGLIHLLRVTVTENFNLFF